MDNSDFSARYTYGLTYYSNRPDNDTDQSHQFLARYTHAFSDRFNIDVRDSVSYSTEPDIMDASGTLYRNGSYWNNTGSIDFIGQWTPLFSTVTTYTNVYYSYDEDTIATEQNSDENTLEQDFRFAVLPKVNLVFGGIYDNLDYQYYSRGYTSYTGNTGLDWQALPSLSLGFRIGGTYTTSDGASDSTSPYANLTANWQLGKRSSLIFNYSHTVAPTDVFVASGQIADRITATFKYDVTPDITVHLEGIYTHSDYTSNLIQSGTISSFDENVVGIDSGLVYHLTPNFDLEGGYLFTNVSSQLDFRDYTRNQFYIGVRGTY